MAKKATGDSGGGGRRGEVESAAAKAKVLEHFGECGTLLEASKRAGEHYSTVRAWRDEDPAFRLALEQANDVFVQVIEEKARQIIIDDGDPKTTMFFLRCLAREKYGDTRKIEHTGPGGMPINIASLEQVKAQLVAVAHQFPTVCPRIRQALLETLDALPKQPQEQ